MAQKDVNVILNGTIVQGNPGETILQVANREGIKIPTLCHDERLEPFSSCYICVVEVEGMRGHQPACSTHIKEGMKVVTDNEPIRQSRQMALELMLSNHYADCLGPCKQTCPAGVDVQGYIALIEKGLYSDAVALIKETNPLPAICGRVCVRPCEVACSRNLLDESAPVGIDYLKRFASDYDLESPDKFVPEIKPSTGKKVAVIGAGPGGLSAGYFLQIEGHQVDIFEAAPQSGGWLRYGIPEYRLPNDILDKEVKNITDLGMNIFYNQKLGENLSYQELKDKYDAVILTIGSQIGTGVGCEGDDAENVFSGIDFLKNMEMTGQRYDFRGKSIAVIGGGNTAMDCCRTSLRCKADNVYVIYRRTEKEMPANPIEIHESKLEGVEYLFLTLPKKINKNNKGEVESVTCIKMKLGEPDASGRRRPVPIEGSEFELNVDYVLAAIGQKTDVNFLDDINANTEGDKLEVNKWADIDADRETLQTGIPSVFAAGDGVTGPATIIEAIAQAKIASTSVHQYLVGEEIKPLKQPFISRRNNFRTQVQEDYQDLFIAQEREEMPVLEADQRMNFHEVELGYADEVVAIHETQRCLECGCTAFFNCDLQKYSTEYNADQKGFAGEFNEYAVDFRHPYIEIDNNKCILCSRCVRICRDVVGANALGLVNRGFETFVSPSMGEALQDTNCESCGMCISTCPTGAITENVLFKPGPVQTTPSEAICNYCSIGCSITLNQVNGFVMSVSGNKGVVNQQGNICRYPRFGYAYLNDKSRIVRPLKKINGKFKEISFEEAFKLIVEKISAVKPDENSFFAGARLTNEEMYLIQKLARAAVVTGNIGSFHYLTRGDGYRFNHQKNAPLDSIRKAGKIFLIGTDINMDHAVAGFMVNNARAKEGIPVILVTEKEESSMTHKVDQVIHVKSYYYFIKAVNHYLLTFGLENDLFLRDRVIGQNEYQLQILEEDFATLVSNAGVLPKVIRKFAEEYNTEMNAIAIFSEKEITSNSSLELFNLAMITGKLGKTANGLITLKEKNNSQGLFDMGISRRTGVGGIPLDDEAYVKKLKDVWNVKDIPGIVADCLVLKLSKKIMKNLFIFGEDPVGCDTTQTYSSLIKQIPFIVVQDYFMTDTAKEADLILPASFPTEIGGTFSNTQKAILEFEPVLPSRIEISSIMQFIELLKGFGLNGLENRNDVFSEIIRLLPHVEEDQPEESLAMVYTREDNLNRSFDYGCDYLVKRFEEEFEERLRV